MEAFRSAGPPAGGEVPPAAGPPDPGARPSFPLGLAALPTWLPWIVGLLLSFAVGFAVGRKASVEARAGESGSLGGRNAAPEQAGTSSPGRGTPGPGSAPAPGAEGGALPTRIEESALFDERNRYTIVVASYARAKEDLAWATYEHVRDEGLAVFPPVASGDLVLVLAGAAPTSGELESLEKEIEELGRDGKKPYHDAYRQGIDKLIQRTIND